MKKLLFVFLLLVSAKIGFSIDKDISSFPYNQKSHSVKEHCNVIVGWYWIVFSLSRHERKVIYNDLRAYYIVKPNMGLHEYLSEKLKGVLTVNEYEQYQQFKNYPEIMFAKGAPKK
jgi:hypothetical protein